MRQLVQNTNSLSVGKLSQNQIKIGSGSGSNVGIYFNNGNENLPGIRFLNSNESVKEWQYSNDGSNWFSIKPGKSSIDLSYELISITSSDLVDGIATIKHNLGQKYILGLDYTVTPDNIEYTDDNTLTLDYRSHENLNCKVWFYKSAQNMLVVPSSVEFLDEQYEGNLIANITIGPETNNIDSGDLIMTKQPNGSWRNSNGFWCLCGPDCCGFFECWKHDNMWEIGCEPGCNRYLGKTLPLNTNLVGYSADSDFESGTLPILSLVIKKQIN